MRPAANVPLTYLLPDWLRAPTLPALVANEIRAVFPVFMLTLIITALSCVVTKGLESIAFLAYGFGCAAISCVSFGHDFAHRTLVATIGQPIERERLWGIRLKISFILMIPLVIIAGVQNDVFRHVWQMLFTPLHAASVHLIIFAIPLLSALTIAPWFTLLCRSALAGTVFSISTPFVLFYLALWIVPEGMGEQRVVTSWGLFLAAFVFSCVVGFFGTLHRFKRLEAVEGSVAGLSGLSWSQPGKEVSRAVNRSRVTSPWIQLAWKELRLQWISLVPTLGMLMTAYAFRTANSEWFGVEELLVALMFWAVGNSVIIGAVGSAEERQLGMTESQGLLPMRKSMQWLVKCAVLFLLVQLVSVNLPLALLPKELPPKLTVPTAKWWTMAALMIVSTSVYVSSCCRTTMKAVLVSLPVTFPVLLFVKLVSAAEERLLAGAFDNAPDVWENLLPYFTPYFFGVAIIWMLHRFACRNHFSAESARGQLARQISWLVVMIVIGSVTWTSVAITEGNR